MPRKLSKTKLIQENRRTKIALDVLIDSMEKGLLDSEYSGNVFTEKTNWSQTCKSKKCGGDLVCDSTNHSFYCSKCFKTQKLVYLGETRTIKGLDEISNSVNSTRSYYLDELKQVSQLLRNLYRITVDNLECPKPTEEQLEKAKKLYKKVHDTIYGHRVGLSCKSSRYDHLYSIIQDGRLMTLDEITNSISKTKYQTMLLLDKIAIQFTMENVIKLVVLDIPNETNKKKLDEKKAHEIIMSVY